jgi:hypothetical protein
MATSPRARYALWVFHCTIFFIIFIFVYRSPADTRLKLSFLAELKITKMQQSMAEVKVEAVDSLSKNSDLINERDIYKQQQQSVSDSLREVKTKLFSIVRG